MGTQFSVLKFDNMKNQELFYKTIGILVNAYLNGTLMHGTCYACAVGNLVAANMGIPCKKDGSRDSWEFAKPFWHRLVIEGMSHHPTPESFQQVAATGYSINQLSMIESAFENADPENAKYDDDERWMFNGLMAVCDTLMEIHEANEEEITQAKRLFVKEPS